MPNPLLNEYQSGILAVLAAAQDGPFRRRWRNEWLTSFGFWAGPASVTQDERVARTERMVRDAIESSDHLGDYDTRVVAQGSSVNNTNVKIESDLDLVVENREWWYRPAPGEQLPAGYGGGTRSFGLEYGEFRRRVKLTLEDVIGAIGGGTKCLHVPKNEGTRVSCDVLPAFRLFQFSPNPTNLDPRGYEGVVFQTTSGFAIVSYPEQHLANGRQKNVASGYRYKQVVRIVKTFAKSAGSSLLTGGPPSSNEIEALVYNVPVHLLMAGDLVDAVVGTLHHLVLALQTPSVRQGLRRVNGIEPLYTDTYVGLTPFASDEARSALIFLQNVHSTVIASP